MNHPAVAMNTQGQGTARIIFSVIEDVAPLDAQFGVDVPRTVPEPLEGPLFGGDEGFGTYALVDGAKAPNLPELIEASGLPAVCLFRGDAAARDGAVAPWLIKLTDGNRFVRGLFSDGGGPADLWSFAPGVFVRCSASIDILAAHLRRFIQLPDPTGRRVFLRYWEPLCLGDFFAGQSDDDTSDLAVAMMALEGHQLGFLGRWDDGAVWLAGHVGPIRRDARPLRLSAADKALFARRIRLAFRAAIEAGALERLAKKGQSYPEADVANAATHASDAVFACPRPETATTKDGIGLTMLLLMMGPEGGAAVLNGPVMQNTDLTMGQRIELTSKSFMTAIKRAAQQEVT